MSANSQIMPKILNIKQLSAYIGLSKTTIYSMIKHSTFPKPLKLSAKRVGWPRDVVDQWLSSKANEQ